MALRNWLRRLEKSAHGETYVISQKDGPPKIFPKSEYQAAWENAWRQMGAGEDAPPEIPRNALPGKVKAAPTAMGKCENTAAKGRYEGRSPKAPARRRMVRVFYWPHLSSISRKTTSP